MAGVSEVNHLYAELSYLYHPRQPNPSIFQVKRNNTFLPATFKRSWSMALFTCAWLEEGAPVGGAPLGGGAARFSTGTIPPWLPENDSSAARCSSCF